MKTLKYVFLLLGCSLIGYLLITVVYLLPTDIIKENVKRGVNIFRSEGDFPELADGYRSTKLDNDTDSVMLANACCPVTNVIKDAMNVPMVIYNTAPDRISSLDSYVYSRNGLTNISTYPRYWHGYLVLLKPLLCFFDFSDLRVMNMFLHSLIWLLLIRLFIIKGYDRYLPALFGLMSLWNVTTISISFQNTSCFLISCLAMMAILKYQQFLAADNDRLNMFFMLTGICTVYFDFLTYPLVTLGLPAVLWISISMNKDNPFLKCKTIIRLTVFWFIGYAGMWLSKWIIASAILHENILANGFRQILLRSSNNIDGEKIGRLACIRLQLSVIARWPNLIIFILLIAFIIIESIRKKTLSNTNIKNRIYSALPYLLLCCYPFLWYCIATNHSVVNPKFAFRTMGITAFSGLIMIIEFMNFRNNDMDHI
jgi:hypothetical protein